MAISKIVLPAPLMREHFNTATPAQAMATPVSSQQLMLHQQQRQQASSAHPLTIGKKAGLVLLCCALLNLTGCAQLGINKQEAGAVTGALIGGVAGSTFGHGAGKTAATIGGTILGGAIGGVIGSYMDKVDRMEVSQALEQSKTNQSVSWSNPDNGNHYQLTPTKTYYANQQPCREYHLNAVIGGKSQQVYGRACRTSQGNWQLVR